ncbi:histidine phosphatase superfamily [Kockovaella imperatae]|uniref:Histidine phosphatase superfamily n=1 Tax=Kockovaella imperatae TaxID=4999 RepID=A0A1Y1UH49_9TREE|nr:histidine phosphatase superfamily [Kockovaella imperatae]ORX37383.1 histidine phosphatase superfamily [Kockovaella imperatae]
MLGIVHKLVSVLVFGTPTALQTTSGDIYGGKTLAGITNFTVVPGIFIQDDPSFNSSGYDLLQDSFGLIDKSPNRWKNLEAHVTQLNKEADAHTTYKLIYIARHGEGFHNLAQSIYGTPAWDCRWSLLTTDGNITWGPDALLDSTGISQAEAVNRAWKEQIKDGVPLPQTLYSSPLRRSASTLNITWHDILLNRGHVPRIKENFRESIGLHTCDQRSNISVIRKTYPGWQIDPSFPFHDPLWDPTYQETDTLIGRRVRQELENLFAEDPSTFLSITCHSGTISGFFLAIGHRMIGVQTGGFVPVLVKATNCPTATMQPISGGQSATAPACTADSTSL